MKRNTIFKSNYISESDYETKKRWKIALLNKWAFKYPSLINFKEEQKRTYSSNYWDQNSGEIFLR